jgi:hypothetical protein
MSGPRRTSVDPVHQRYDYGNRLSPLAAPRTIATRESTQSCPRLRDPAIPRRRSDSARRTDRSSPTINKPPVEWSPGCFSLARVLARWRVRRLPACPACAEATRPVELELPEAG